MRNVSPIKPANTGTTSFIFASRGPGVSTLVKQMTGNGGNFNSMRSYSRSPSPTSPLRSSTSSTEPVLPPVTKHSTGNNIAKLTQQLTGNGLTFLTGGGRLPAAPEGMSIKDGSDLIIDGFTVRSSSPEPKPLHTLVEEDDEQPSRQKEKENSKTTLGHSRSLSKGELLSTYVANKTDSPFTRFRTIDSDETDD